MRNFVLKFTLVLVLLLTVFGEGSAQDYIWRQLCPAFNGDYSQNGVFPRYEYRNRRLVLVDIQTREVVQELETSLETPEFRFSGWSPDCRYLVGVIGYDGRDNHITVIWDVAASSRVIEFTRRPNAYGVLWSPDSRYAVMGTSNGTYLFDVAANTNRFLSEANFNSVDWDNERRQVIISHIYGDVIAYDLNNGQVMTSFDVPVGYAYPRFELSPDNSKIAVYSDSLDGFLAIWDRDTLTENELYSDRDTAGPIITVAISPSNRYLATLSNNSLRIWDLNNLPGDPEAREPLYFYFIQIYPRNIYFIDDDTIENEDGERWNIHTGEPVPEA